MKQILLYMSMVALASGQKFASVSVRAADPPNVAPAARIATPKLAFQANRLTFSFVTMWRFLQEAFPSYSWLQVQMPVNYDLERRYSLTASLPPNAKASDTPKMMQAMLADKFSMVSKTVMASTGTLSLQVSKQIKFTAPQATAKASVVYRQPQPVTITIPNVDGTPGGLTLTNHVPLHAPAHYELSGTMADLVAFLSDHTHYVVRDDTKISGIYAFKLDIRTPNSTTLDINGHIVDAQRDRRWTYLCYEFQYALEPLGLELKLVNQNLPNIVITKLDSMPKP